MAKYVRGSCSKKPLPRIGGHHTVQSVQQRRVQQRTSIIQHPSLCIFWSPKSRAVVYKKPSFASISLLLINSRLKCQSALYKCRSSEIHFPRRPSMASWRESECMTIVACDSTRCKKRRRDRRWDFCGQGFTTAVFYAGGSTSHAPITI